MFRNTQGKSVRTCTVLKPGRVDRSPCGRGSSANQATMAARGLVKPGDVLESRSIIDSTFKVEFLGETHVGNVKAVLPRITGRAWIYVLTQVGWTRPIPIRAALRFPTHGGLTPMSWAKRAAETGRTFPSQLLLVSNAKAPRVISAGPTSTTQTFHPAHQQEALRGH